MPKRIPAMTSAQTRRVQETCAALTAEWLEAQGFEPAGPAGIVAFADLGRDVYIGGVELTYTTPKGAKVSADVQWELDADFQALGEPQVKRRRNARR